MVDPKDKHLHKNKHGHVQTHMWDTFEIVKLSVELGEGRKGKEKDRASTML
jgi:hypothetical protein